MSVGLLLVMHGKLGHLLIETMTDMLGPLPLETDVLEVRRVQATDVLLRQGVRMIERLDRGAGVLLLTDAYGSTPANIANQLASGTPTLVVAGVNLPMLVRVFNYPALSLDEMARAAVEGGRKGITLCPRLSS
ncbi:PTS sugar transporter subunit IIA [Hydrocarboniphaga sp.]|uniref:PTS sugar transporter subunit IIA n=1 Tax=Hydrocarboniphaga sp. TaxID=2033016 RepID=UPI003D09DD40